MVGTQEIYLVTTKDGPSGLFRKLRTADEYAEDIDGDVYGPETFTVRVPGKVKSGVPLDKKYKTLFVLSYLPGDANFCGCCLKGPAVFITEEEACNEFYERALSCDDCSATMNIDELLTEHKGIKPPKQCVYLLLSDMGPFSAYRTKSDAAKYNKEHGDSVMKKLEVNVPTSPRKVQTPEQPCVPLDTRHNLVYVVGYTECEESCMCYDCAEGLAVFTKRSLAEIELRRRAVACSECRENEDNRLVMLVIKVGVKQGVVDEISPYDVLTSADIEAIERQGDSE